MSGVARSAWAAAAVSAAAVGALVYLRASQKGGKNASKPTPLADIPTIDLDLIRSNKESDQERRAAECRKVVESLHTYGVLVVRDSRCTEDDNNEFLDMMESYFELDDKEKKKDSRPELHYQVGSTPDGVEHARSRCKEMAELPGEHRPVTLCPPSKDVKWRFFWRIGERPDKTDFEDLNAKPVIPAAFPQWEEQMDKWGNKLRQAVYDITGAASEGFGWPAERLQSMMDKGPHLLAPTGTNLVKFGKKNTVMAGYHTDLNFITCHGKSRFPGLYIWLRDGTKASVKVPDGCLLMQAGQQIEWLTAGYVMAGFHEVVVTDATLKAAEKAGVEGRSQWRVSSTLFGHLRSDVILEPLEQFNKYPPTPVGKQVLEELAAINLSSEASSTH